MKHLGLFEGIGGFSLAARWMGWETVAWCEWNPFGQQVLKYHFPEAEGHGDITKTDFTKYANRIDILTGGFPCQPYSAAGKRLGTEDERHLWPEMLRAIREIQPRYIVGENVRGLTNWNGGLVFDEVQAELEAEGYEVLPFLLPACAVNAPHRRDRIWFIAYSISNRSVGRASVGNKQEKAEGERASLQQQASGFSFQWSIANAKGKRGSGLSSRTKEESTINGSISGDGLTPNTRSTGWKECNTAKQSRGKGECARLPVSKWDQWPTQSPVCNGDDGLSTRLDGITFSKWRNESIKAGGNAIVPQVAYEIFKSIAAYELEAQN